MIIGIVIHSRNRGIIYQVLWSNWSLLQDILYSVRAWWIRGTLGLSLVFKFSVGSLCMFYWSKLTWFRWFNNWSFEFHVFNHGAIPMILQSLAFAKDPARHGDEERVAETFLPAKDLPAVWLWSIAGPWVMPCMVKGEGIEKCFRMKAKVAWNSFGRCNPK